MTRHYWFLLALVIISFIPPSLLMAEEFDPWAVYYSDKVTPEELMHYKLLVLDSDYHPDMAPLIQSEIVLLGYISLGEVEQGRKHFKDVKAEGILLDENPNWKGSFYVDVRDPRWTDRVIKELVPKILARGFDGLFLDTLDNPPHLESTDPVKFKGMVEASVNLIKRIRLHFPYIQIMVNRAYPLLPQVAPYINMVLGESIYADYNFETKQYGLVEPGLYQHQVQLLQSLKKRNAYLEIFTLDYWDPEDSKGIQAVYDKERKNGFHPYVSTIKLDQIIKEPNR